MADADYEPADEDLEELAREAFAGVKAANDEALAKLRREIAALGRATPQREETPSRAPSK